MRSQDILISGTTLLEEPQKLAIDLGADFEPSESWIEPFKKREKITFQNLHGEKVADKYLRSFL